MGRYLFRRAIQGLFALFVLGTIVFFLARVTGNPVDLLLPPDATEEDRQYMIHQLRLDRPYYEQYFEFVTDALRGDLGKSIRFGKPTTQLYWERFPNTLKLGGMAWLMAVVMAIPLGVLAGSRRGTPIDSIASFLAVVGIAAPNFWMGLVFIQVFAVQLGVLPSARMGGFDHYILPAFTMSFFALAGMVRLLRSSMIEVMDSEFVKLARIKGVSTRMVVWKHCLRNSLIPVLTYAGMYVSVMISGAIVVETIFAWPGVGRLAYEGISYRDYPLVQATVLIHGAIIILVNFIVDMIYSYVDPRIRRE
ncbi:MAG: ABC transporter permease [Chloroflexi bacterium]|nr:ABC transporter permease [Chloroflexota bacterium]